MRPLRRGAWCGKTVPRTGNAPHDAGMGTGRPISPFSGCSALLFLKSRDLGEQNVHGGLWAGTVFLYILKIRNLLRIFSARKIARFHCLYYLLSPENAIKTGIVQWCWHNFHCRIFYPGTSCSLSVGEPVLGERHSGNLLLIIRKGMRSGSPGHIQWSFCHGKGFLPDPAGGKEHFPVLIIHE